MTHDVASVWQINVNHQIPISGSTRLEPFASHAQILTLDYIGTHLDYLLNYIPGQTEGFLTIGTHAGKDSSNAAVKLRG